MRLEHRFSKRELRALLQRRSEEVSQAVRSLGPDAVLATPVADLVERLYEQYRVEPVAMDLGSRRSAGAKDVSIEVEGWSGQTVRVDGTRVEHLIPFAGDVVLLDARPSTFNYNAPAFEIRGQDIVAAYEGRAPLDPQQAKAALDGLLSAIGQHLSWQLKEIEPWNQELLRSLPEQLEARRTKVLRDRELDSFLEVPVSGRPNASPTFAVDPPKRIRPLEIEQHRPTGGFTPEPAISEEGFSSILAEIESVTTAVQRLPRTFVSMPEESLRDVLLVVLNNRFGPASGETFSRSGKTDIFIPWGGDQRAVFIAECKWWKGAAGFTRAIDQLLGYMTWRDSQAALIVFVKSGSPEEVGEKAHAALLAHPSFKRIEAMAGRTTYTLRAATDERRELHLALLIIPVLP